MKGNDQSVDLPALVFACGFEVAAARGELNTLEASTSHSVPPPRRLTSTYVPPHLLAVVLDSQVGAAGW